MSINLPTELLISVFSQLDPWSLAQTQQVCKDWHLVGNDNHVWKQVFQANPYFEDVSDKPTRNWKQVCISQYAIVRHLQLHKVQEWTFNFSNPSNRLLRFQEYFQSLGQLPCFLENVGLTPCLAKDVFSIKEYRFNRILTFNSSQNKIRIYSRKNLINELDVPQVEGLSQPIIKTLTIIDKYFLGLVLEEGLIEKNCQSTGKVIFVIPYAKDTSSSMVQISTSSKLAFLPHPRTGFLASISSENQSFEILNIHRFCRGEHLPPFLIKASSVIYQLLSRQEKIVSFNKADNQENLLIWDANTCAVKHCYKIDNHVKFAITNEKLISLFKDPEDMEIYDAHTGKTLFTLNIIIYDIETGKTIKKFKLANDVELDICVNHAVYAHGHLFLPVVNTNQISIIRIASKEFYHLNLPDNFHCQDLKSLSFYDGQLIAVNQAGNLHAWNWNSAESEQKAINRVPIELINSPKKNKVI